MSFYEVIQKFPYEYVHELIYNATEKDVINALHKENSFEY